jgi:hypothetical protein
MTPIVHAEATARGELFSGLGVLALVRRKFIYSIFIFDCIDISIEFRNFTVFEWTGHVKKHVLFERVGTDPAYGLNEFQIVGDVTAPITGVSA